MNAQSPHKWWSTRKSAVFRLSSSLQPLVGGGGGLVCESVGKADLLSDQFDSKQSTLKKKIGRFDSMNEFCRCLQNVSFAFVK